MPILRLLCTCLSGYYRVALISEVTTIVHETKIDYHCSKINVQTCCYLIGAKHIGHNSCDSSCDFNDYIFPLSLLSKVSIEAAVMTSLTTTPRHISGRTPFLRDYSLAPLHIATAGGSDNEATLPTQ